MSTIARLLPDGSRPKCSAASLQKAAGGVQLLQNLQQLCPPSTNYACSKNRSIQKHTGRRTVSKQVAQDDPDKYAIGLFACQHELLQLKRFNVHPVLVSSHVPPGYFIDKNNLPVLFQSAKFQLDIIQLDALQAKLVLHD